MNWSSSIDEAFPKPLRVVLRGVGQVFFCCNALTGLIFLVALYIGGLSAGAAATVGVITSTVTAYLLGFSEDDIDAGLYGFNGTLVGPCLFLFLEHSPQLWLYVVLASMLSTVVLAALMRILQPYNVPASTSPFVLTCWMFMVAVYSFDSFSLRGAAMALGGAVVGVVVPTLLGASQTLIEMGLYGFNPVLTMMAIGWVFLKPTARSAVLALLAGIVTVVCQAGLANFLAPVGLPTLTFPVVLVMWMFLFAAAKSKYWSDTAAK